MDSSTRSWSVHGSSRRAVQEAGLRAGRHDQRVAEVAEHGVEGAVAVSRATGGVLEAIAPTYVPHIPNTITR